MHYGPKDFAIDRSKPTIITKHNEKIGQRKGASAQDILEIRKLYGCEKGKMRKMKRKQV